MFDRSWYNRANVERVMGFCGRGVRGRVNALRFFLNEFDYEGKDTSVVYEPDPLIVLRSRDAVGD